MKTSPFLFRNDALMDYLSNRQSQLPTFARSIALELSEQVRGMDFKDPDPQGRVSVHMFEHTFEEVCAFVDWAVSMWNQELRLEYRSRKLTAEELIANTLTREGSPRDGLLMLFESWNEFRDQDDAPYLSLDSHPLSRFKEDPIATVGNVCAAFGLAILDRCLEERANMSTEEVLSEFGDAWQCASLARWLNHTEMGIHFNIAGESARMARAARARHSKDPKQKVKLEVRGLWEHWEKNPRTYRSSAAFARDMLDKWPEQLTSIPVVERWVRSWRKEKAGRPAD